MRRLSFKPLCIFLTWVLLLNPLLASAAKIFLQAHPSVDATVSNISVADIAVSDVPESTIVNCHSELVAHSAGSSVSQPAHNSIPPSKSLTSATELAGHTQDCCQEQCQCDDSLCHQLSVLTEHKDFAFAINSELSEFVPPRYLSISFTPSSPPPIA